VASPKADQRNTGGSGCESSMYDIINRYQQQHHRDIYSADTNKKRAHFVKSGSGTCGNNSSSSTNAFSHSR